MQRIEDAYKTLEKLKSKTLGPLGNAGDKQSNTMAVSLKISAASRYILHSGSKAVGLVNVSVAGPGIIIER